MSKRVDSNTKHRSKFFPPMKNLHYRILNFWPIAFWLLLAVSGFYLVSKMSEGQSFSGVYECDRTTLSSVEGGLVKSVFFAIGDEVSSEDSIVELDSVLVDAEISERRSSLENEARERMRKRLDDLQEIDLSIQEWSLSLREVRAEHLFLTDELARLGPLVEKKLVSQIEYSKVESRVEQLSFSLEEIPNILSNLHTNRKRIEEVIDTDELVFASGDVDPVVEFLEVQRERLSIRANRAGIVTEVYYDEAEVIQPGGAVVEVAHFDSSRVLGFIPFASGESISVGDVVEVVSSVRSELVYGGVVSKVSPVMMSLDRNEMRSNVEKGHWFTVNLDTDSELVVGESVKIRLESEMNWMQFLGGL